MSRFLTLKWNNKGVILAEVLLAIIILSVGLTVIINSFLSSFRASALAEDYSKASFLAENKMYGLMQRGYIEGGVDDKGNFPSPYEKFKFQLKTRNLNENKNETPDMLNEVTLSLSWPAGRKTKEMVLSTYLLNLPE